MGIPLCWGMTLLRRIRASLSSGDRKLDQAAPRRALFILLSESGSMILADPAVRAMAAAGVEVHFLTFAHTRPALAVAGTVPEERIFSVRADSLFALLGDLWRWRCWLRTRRIDTLVDLELFACASALLGACSGVHRRIGFHAVAKGTGRYRGDLYSHKVTYDPGRHISLNYLALTEILLERQLATGRDLPAPVLRPLQAAEIAAVRTLLAAALPSQLLGKGRLVLVNPNASEFLPQRRWPVPHFVALICRLLERHADLQVLLIGGPGDQETTGAIAASVADRRCTDIAGRLTLPELPALFAEAAVLVSNDSGPAHFAAVSRMPVVVLFGPETPTLYRPLGPATVLNAALPCSPCVNAANQRRTACRNNRCMSAISVDTVLGAVEKVLDAAARRSKVVPLPVPPPPSNSPQWRQA